jgi:hypothetical protein
MKQSELKLDGNAIAGLLREIFTTEMTTAHSTLSAASTFISTRQALWSGVQPATTF